jgi:hypothetical protein
MDVSGPQRSTVSDLSPAGKDYFRRFIDELPNEKGVIIPLRPPVIAFHREEDLRSAERLPVELLAILKREKLIRKHGEEKMQYYVRNILKHQEDRDMTDRTYVEVPKVP